MQKFRLVPFPTSELPKLDINGEILRAENRLSIRYKMTGNINQILLPLPTASPSRRHDLWKATCFEFFLAIPNQPQYWEFNMSPSGDWNVYMMDAYRQVNMREELAFTELPFASSKTKDEVVFDISVDLNPVLQPNQVLQIGVTTIIQTADGNESFWALTHLGLSADFHQRDSFIVNVHNSIGKS